MWPKAVLQLPHPSSSLFAPSSNTSTVRSSSPSCRGVILMMTELSAVSATDSSLSSRAERGTGERRCIGEGGGTGEMGGGA